MGELSVRRNREMAVPKYQKSAKTEKQSGPEQARPAARSGRTSATVSETLRQLMGRITQAGRQAREDRRTLQSGEAALAEVEDNLREAGAVSIPINILNPIKGTMLEIGRAHV